ncbi:MAG: tRNA pseudouridine(55) synthase TruB [Clostridia bacterium]|nr:tRNA pseudouridine(55) synthase TruB [Clostridia bacterium]
MKSGVVILNKENGMTSHTAVARLKRLFAESKAGHTGTLDPLAEGVLPILLGRAVKASEYMLTSDKHYKATLLLGITTDTEDVTGTVLSRSSDVPTEEAVIAAVNSMLGKSMQIPPMYSALKVGGKKLCDLAREGKSIEREPREITVHSIACKKITDTEYELDIKCSKGTYIRTLLKDVGERLGVGGVMKTLTRMESAGFALSEAKTLAEIEAMSNEERDALVIPVDRIFENNRKITLPPFFAHLARCGVEIYLKKLNLSLPISERVRLYDENGVFFALGEVRDFNGESAIKPIKQFDI